MFFINYNSYTALTNNNPKKKVDDIKLEFHINKIQKNNNK